MKFPPKMVNRRRSHISSSHLAADQLRIKLTRLNARQNQLKIAYQQLQSQIKIGLLQAEEVFSSLAIPLMRLVGLKTVEMAEEGKFTTIIIDRDSPNHRHEGRRNGVVYESTTASPVSVGREDGDNLKVGNCVTKVSIAGRELLEKQETQFIQLVRLLKQIENQVNSSQNNILQTLADHRVSLQKLFRRTTFCLSNSQHQNSNYYVNMEKLLQGLFDYMGTVLGSVESGVDGLIQSLADNMCNPMVEYVKGLKADMKFGACMRLLDTVEEMEMEIRNGRLELEEARRRIRVAEEGKVEALSKLHETQERVRRFNEYFSLLSESKNGNRKPCLPHKFLDREEGEESDDKLLWELLKKRKCQAPESPMGPPQLLNLEPNKKQRKSTREIMLLTSHRTGSWKCTHGGLQGPQATRLEGRIPLGSSPSAAIKRDVSRNHTTP